MKWWDQMPSLAGPNMIEEPLIIFLALLHCCFLRKKKNTVIGKEGVFKIDNLVFPLVSYGFQSISIAYVVIKWSSNFASTLKIVSDKPTPANVCIQTKHPRYRRLLSSLLTYKRLFYIQNSVPQCFLASIILWHREVIFSFCPNCQCRSWRFLSLFPTCCYC